MQGLQKLSKKEKIGVKMFSKLLYGRVLWSNWVN